MANRRPPEENDEQSSFDSTESRQRGDEVGFWADIESAYDFPSATHLEGWDEWKAREDAAVQHDEPMPPQKDPYTLVGVLRMHARMFERKGLGEFRLLYGKKRLGIEKIDLKSFSAWRSNDARQIVYVPKARDTELSTGYLTEQDEFDRMLDLVIRAKEHENTLQRPSWQEWAKLVGPPPQEPLTRDDKLLLFLNKCAENGCRPTLHSTSQATGIPTRTIQRERRWQNFRSLIRGQSQDAKRSWVDGDVDESALTTDE